MIGELEKAWFKLIDEVAKITRIDKFVKWAAEKLHGYQ